MNLMGEISDALSHARYINSQEHWGMWTSATSATLAANLAIACLLGQAGKIGYWKGHNQTFARYDDGYYPPTVYDLGKP